LCNEHVVCTQQPYSNALGYKTNSVTHAIL
jgi:hypothetical protein